MGDIIVVPGIVTSSKGDSQKILVVSTLKINVKITIGGYQSVCIMILNLELIENYVSYHHSLGWSH